MRHRQLNRDELLAILTPVFRTRTSDEWIGLAAGKLPVGKVNTFAEALDTYAAEYPSQIVEWEHDTLGTVRTVGCPIRISGNDVEPRPAPRLGADNAAVLDGLDRLGESEERTAALAPQTKI